MGKGFRKSVLSRSGCVVLALVVISVPACYTLLRHPRVVEEDYTRAEIRSCSSCHTDVELWRFHHPLGPYYRGFGYYDPWVYFYDLPWWYDAYWFYPEGGPQTVPMHERSLRPEAEKGTSTEMRGRYLRSPSGTKSPAGKLKSGASKEKEKQDENKAKDKRSPRKSRKKKKNEKDG